MAEIFIGRTAKWYRPYEYNGKYVDSIKLFNESGVIYETSSGWLENSTFNIVTSYVSGKDVEYIEIEEPKLKRKIDFSTKHNFYVTVKDDILKETKIVLYILCNDENSKVKIEKIDSETTIETSLDIYEKVISYTEFTLTGVSETPITLVQREVKKNGLTELGKRAQELNEKHKNTIHLNLDIYGWARLLKQYDLIEKKI